MEDKIVENSVYVESKCLSTENCANVRTSKGYSAARIKTVIIANASEKGRGSCMI